MKKLLTLVLSLLALTLWGLSAHAASMEGLQFDDQTRVANRELKLNGLGIRSIFIFKAYVAGLYVSDKVASTQDVQRYAGPIRLQLRMLMEVGSTDIKQALVDGMRKNVNEAQWQAMQDRVADFSRTIESIGVVRPGDTINLDFVPERGLLLAVNGVDKGGAIRGLDFYSAMLAVFVGDDPVDTRLKRGLLGLLAP
jgi:Chalcone isomerase-like